MFAVGSGDDLAPTLLPEETRAFDAVMEASLEHPALTASRLRCKTRRIPLLAWSTRDPDVCNTAAVYPRLICSIHEGTLVFGLPKVFLGPFQSKNSVDF